MAEAEILGLSPGFTFEPRDAELAEHFLLPRLLGQPLPLDGIFIDDDPRSAPPWKLFARHGRNNMDDAYFFSPADTAKNRQGRRACVGGGTWVGQKVEAKGELRLDDEQTMAWQKYRLNFHLGSGKIRSGSTGWVMLEYSVVVPERASCKICHISFTGHGNKRKRVPDGYVDSEIAAAPASTSTTTHHVCHQEPFLQQPPVAYNVAAAAHAATIPWSTEQQASGTSQIILEQEQPPVLDQETGTPEQNGTTAALQMEQESGMQELLLEVDEVHEDPVLRSVLESLGEFATAAQTDADFGDYWADAGQHCGET